MDSEGSIFWNKCSISVSHVFEN